MPETIPIACTLDRENRPDRARWMARLGSDLVRLEVKGRHATLSFRTSRSVIDEFVRVEAECCAFFSFEIVERERMTTLDAVVPEGADWALRGLVAGFVAGWDGLL